MERWMSPLWKKKIWVNFHYNLDLPLEVAQNEEWVQMSTTKMSVAKMCESLSLCVDIFITDIWMFLLCFLMVPLLITVVIITFFFSFTSFHHRYTGRKFRYIVKNKELHLIVYSFYLTLFNSKTNLLRWCQVTKSLPKKIVHYGRKRSNLFWLV